MPANETDGGRAGIVLFRDDNRQFLVDNQVEGVVVETGSKGFMAREEKVSA